VAQTKSTSSETGFSLIELLVSLVITMVGLLGLLATINLSIATNLGNELRLKAVGIGEDYLNEAKQLPFANITASGDKILPPGNYYVRGIKKNYTIVKSVTSFTNTKRITVGVSWLYKNQALEHTVSTMIGQSYGK